MADKGTEYTLCALAGIGVIALLYVINQKTERGAPVPGIQREEQMMALAIPTSKRYGIGTCLDTNHPDHGWHPGYDPDPSAQPVTQSKHRYPAVAGGNISNVMHGGWSSMAQKAPAGWEWQLNPPEASVL